MKKEINFAIAGFGGIAKTHAIAAYTANLTLNLPYSLNLKSIVTRKPVEYTIAGVKNELDINRVLQDDKIDFIDICTPNDVHVEGVKKALEFNKPIYCEKPLSSTYEEAFFMAKLVKEKQLKNGVALIYRFMPAVRLIKKELEEGTIGDIIDFKIKLYHKSYLDPNKKGTWRTNASSGGGALLDLGVHLIDTIYFTMGEIEKVKCRTNIFFKDRTSVDEIASCDFTLKGGISGNLEVSRIFADREEPTTFVIYGSKGSIKMDSGSPFTIEVYHYDSNMTEIKSANGKGDILKYYAGERNSLGFHLDCHMAGIVNFANIVCGINADENIMPDFEDGLRAQKVIEASYKSASCGREIEIKEI